MKILYLHRTQGEEPEAIHINAMVTALRDLGHHVAIVGPQASRTSVVSHGRALARIKRGMPAPAFEMAQILYNAVSYPHILRAVRRFRPDLVYERYALYHFAGCAAAKRQALPHILEVNTPYASAWARYYRLYFPPLARRIENHVCRRTDALVVVTQALKAFLVAQGHPAGKIVVTHNAIDPSRFRPDVDPGPARAEVGAGPDRLIVGFVGTMNRWQGLPLLVDVIRRVNAEDPRVVFLIVGDGELRGAFQQELARLGLEGAVHFAGRRPHDEIPRYIALFDIALVPHSNTYGSPMKVFEYFAMGKCVIAPRLGPLQEIVQDGENGVLFPPEDGAALAREILRLSGAPDTRARLGAQARARVLTDHVWEHNAHTVVSLYRSIASQMT